MLNKFQVVAVSAEAQRKKVRRWILRGTGHSNATVSKIQARCSEVENITGKFLYLKKGHFLGAKCTELNRSVPRPAVRRQALLPRCGSAPGLSLGKKVMDAEQVHSSQTSPDKWACFLAFWFLGTCTDLI